MVINGIEVNVDAIAAGMLDMVHDLGESYETALKFGMLPAPLMDLLDRCLADKARELSAPAWLFEGLPELEAAAEKARKEWVRAVAHQVAMAMYHKTDMVV